MVFPTGCDSGPSGWYLMFCAGQYVVGELSEPSGRSGYASWLSLRPLSGARRPLILIGPPGTLLFKLGLIKPLRRNGAT